MKPKLHTSPFVAVALLLLGFTAMIPAASGHPTSCHITTYAADYEGRHFSLLKNNSTLIGNDIVFESNCAFKYQFDHNAIFESNGNTSTPLPLSTTSITIFIDNQTHIFDSLTVYPSSSIFYGAMSEELSSDKTDGEIWFGEIISHVITFLILYFLSTTVIYQIARKRVDESITVVV